MIFLPIITATIIYIFHNKWINFLVFINQIILSLMAFLYFHRLKDLKEHMIHFGAWQENIGISLRNDQFSLALILVSILIWWTVILYEWNKRKRDSKFLFFLLFLEGTFLGMLQTYDFFNLFVFIEIITVLSTVLIIYKKDGASLRAGLFYLIFNSMGILLFIFGLSLLYMTTGTLNMGDIQSKIGPLKDLRVIHVAYIFMIISMGVKSAFFPVYNWLPKAHGAAPVSVSALLSGLLVKTGIYGFIRINEVIPLEGYNVLFSYLGILTALSGIIFALCQKDIKLILSFHTISQIGIILMAISMGKDGVYEGGILHLINHTIFKSLLFLGAGVVINEYHNRDVTKIRGMFQRSPMLSIWMIIGMLSITGTPFFSGYISKSLIGYGLNTDSIKYFMFQLINVGTMASFIKVSQIFVGDAVVLKGKYFLENISMMILATASIAIGIFYKGIAKTFLHIEINNIDLFIPQKWASYFFSLIIAYLLYNYFIKRDGAAIKNLRSIDISFETASIMLGSFVFILLLFSRFTV